MSEPMLFAHRGAAIERPENTMVSFQRALEHGAFALETDVHMTRDGHIVVSHDADGRRMAGEERSIRASTLAEVKRWDLGRGFVDATGERPFAGQGVRMPTLEELLVAFPAVALNIDMKQTTPSMVKPMLALLEKHGAPSRVLLASFSSRTLREVRASGYVGTTELGRDKVLRLRVLPRMLLRYAALHNVRAQLPVRQGPLRFDDRAFIEKCHALGVKVDFWTINDVTEARRLLELGADGIMSDDPRCLAGLLP